MSGNKTTNITNTGLGDEQYEQLQTNQTGIGDQVQEGFAGASGRFDTVDAGITGIGTKIDSATTGINANTDTGFTNLTSLLSTYGDSLTQGQTDATAGRKTYYDNLLSALENNTGGLSTQLETGFGDATNRFDTLDDSVGGVQQTADNISTDVGNVQSSVDDGFAAADTRFDTLDAGQTTAATTATTNADALGTQLTNTQAEILGGQGTLQDNLDNISSTADTYAGQILENQGTLQSGQDGFKSSFDDYVDRYTEDTELATTARSDLATAQANQTDRLREDLGQYAQATAEGQGNIAQTIGTLGTGIDAGFETIGSAVGTGFSQASMEDQTAAKNFSTRLDNVRDLISTTSDASGAETSAQYTALANSFDENGQLITDALDSQGNTIKRSMTEQGLIIERKLDVNGNEISAVSMDVEKMLGNAEAYEQSLMGQLDKRFDQSEESTSTELQAIARGFTQQSKKMDTQARDLATLAAEQTDLDLNIRNEFKQLGQAFDDQGNLIQNSVLENGTSVSRAIDKNGNLLLRSFSATGERVGDQVLNINRTLNNLSQLNTRQGANVSMGNLSPAMSAGVPSTGFASPFATTR